MTVLAISVSQLRRYIAEPAGASDYSDTSLIAVIERYPLLVENTWDLNAAAAEIWEEKAAAYATTFDFAADGGDYKRSQVHAQMLKQARRFRALRQAGVVELALPSAAAEAVEVA